MVEPRKKRPRTERLQQYGVPDIPGLAVQVIPLQLYALKQCTRFFQTATECVSIINDDDASHSGTSNRVPANQVARASSAQQDPLTAILDRMEHHTDSATSAANDAAAARSRQDAITSWLNAIHRCIESYNNNASSSVAVSALQHVWSIATRHTRVAVKRAALYMAGHVLQKSKDCRSWLLESDDTKLVQWMDCVAAEPNKALQQEACGLLQRLVQLGYADVYPTLPVALQRLRQSCPNWNATHSNVNSTMMKFRKDRDMALIYYEQEERLVEKLLKRAYKCMDVIVPRMVDGQHNLPAEMDDESEDEVDWEDGCERDADHDDELHTSVVDRTIATMQATATGLREGRLKIHMDQLPNDGTTISETVDAGKQKAREKLECTVQTLAVRHLPRLTAWSDGLTQADTLVQAKNGTRSFVSMPAARASLRVHVLARVSSLKSEFSSLLASAQKLGISLHDETRVASNASLVVGSETANLVGVAAARQNLTATSTTRQRGRGATSMFAKGHRIKIKLKK